MLLHKMEVASQRFLFSSIEFLCLHCSLFNERLFLFQLIVTKLPSINECDQELNRELHTQEQEKYGWSTTCNKYMFQIFVSVSAQNCI